MYLRARKCLRNQDLKEGGQRYATMQVSYIGHNAQNTVIYETCIVKVSSEIVINDQETKINGWTLLSPLEKQRYVDNTQDGAQFLYIVVNHTRSNLKKR